MTFRLGYRSAIVVPPEADAVGNAAAREDDLAEREGRFEGDARAGLLFAGKKAEDDDDENDNPPSPAVALVHNLSEEYALHVLRSSPLVRRYKIDGEENGGREKKNVELISLAHNPETQIAAYLMSNHHQHATAADSTPLLRRACDHMKRRLASSFVGYEIAVQDGLIDGYGVDSNGLSLPRSHNMHLDWRDVLECAADADVHGEDGGNGGSASSSSSLRTIRLPSNVLETRGLEVAREVCAYLEGDDDGSPSEDSRRDDPLSEQDGKLRKAAGVCAEASAERGRGQKFGGGMFSAGTRRGGIESCGFFHGRRREEAMSRDTSQYFHMSDRY